MVDSLLEGAQRAISLAKAVGADAAFASMSRFRSVSVEVRDGELEKVQESTDTSLGLELYVEGRYSTHSTNDFAPASLAEFVEQAVALTRTLEVDEHRRLPDAGAYEPADLDLYDATVEARSLDARLAQANALNAGLAGRDGVISATSSVFDGHGESGVVSSSGFAGIVRGTLTGLSASVTLRDVGDKRPEAGWAVSTRHLGQLPVPQAVGDEAMLRARRRLGTAKGPTMRTTMVVDRHAAASLVVRLLGPTSGSAVQQGRSMWADALGQRRVSETLSIVSNPLIPRGVGSRPFDDEGFAAFEMPIIEEGTLKNYFLDTYYARKLGTKPTTGSWGNIIVKPGTRDLATIVGKTKRAIYVTDWLGGNADPTTGDFSFGVQGHIIEGGEIGAPIGEMNVTGNLLSLFRNLEEVGSDPWEHSMLRVPTLVFADVQFSGT